MSIENASSSMCTPAGCYVPVAASVDAARADDEHCTPLGCGRARLISIDIAPRWGAEILCESCCASSSRGTIHAKTRRALMVSLVLLTSVVWGCAGSKAPSSNSNAVSNTKASTNSDANAETHPSSSQSAAIDIKEPERYRAALTISIQGASGAPASMATQQFGYAKLGADRRWAFTLPAPLGRIVYLEKSG